MKSESWKNMELWKKDAKKRDFFLEKNEKVNSESETIRKKEGLSKSERRKKKGRGDLVLKDNLKIYLFGIILLTELYIRNMRGNWMKN